jgi:hypothetical protein
MTRSHWTHIGTVWTNGQPFLALDESLLPAWRGYSDEHYDRLVHLGPDVTSVTVGPGTAALISTDGTVYDEGWLQVYRADGPRIAVVQAAGRDYAQALTTALEYPDNEDEPGDTVGITSGTLVLLDACIDGAGEYSAPIQSEAPGPSPTHWPRYDNELADTGGLRLNAPTDTYRLSVRWLTEVPGTDVCFARWILQPEKLG